MFLRRFYGSAIFINNIGGTLKKNGRRAIHKQLPEAVSSTGISQHDLELMERNASIRKGHGDIGLIRELQSKIEFSPAGSPERSALLQEFNEELYKLPNQTHPEVAGYGEEPKILQTCNEYPKFDFEPLAFPEIAKKLNLLRMEHLGNFTGHKSYYFMSLLAELEHALTQYALEEVSKHGFDLYSVPDILPADTIESCGMATSGERTQVSVVIYYNFLIIA